MDQITKINLNESSPGTPKTPNLQRERIPLMSTKTKEFPWGKVMLVVAIVAGLSSGFLLAKRRLLLAGITPGQQLEANPADASAITAGKVFGSADEKTFRDSAEGVIQPGGIDGEGSHHLERGEDKSQWVYLTSSVIDLDNFVSHKVTIWGETVQGKKAGWLMDVGRLKVIELNVAEVNSIEPAE